MSRFHPRLKGERLGNVWALENKKKRPLGFKLSFASSIEKDAFREKQDLFTIAPDIFSLLI
jgi:hypothetical protein